MRDPRPCRAAPCSAARHCSPRRRSSGRRAPPSSCVVGTWGGDYARLLRENIDDPILKPKGIEVVQDVGDETPRIAKLTAQTKLPRGTLDIACVGALNGYRVNDADLVETLDATKVPNLKHVLPICARPASCRTSTAPRCSSTIRTTVTDPPQSFADLLDPKWKGKVGMVSTVAPWVMMARQPAARAATTTDFDKAKAFMLKLNANGLRLYPETDSAGAGLQVGRDRRRRDLAGAQLHVAERRLPGEGPFPEGRRDSLCLRHGGAEERARQGSRVQIPECACWNRRRSKASPRTWATCRRWTTRH